MASIPDTGGMQPGDAAAQQPDPVMNAVNQGHDWTDISAYAGPDAQQPPLSSIWPTQDINTPGRDAINEGAGPIGEGIMMGAAGAIAGAAAGTAAVAEDVVSSRAASLGVTASTDEAAAAQPLANPDTVRTLGKVARRGAAAFIGSAVYTEPFDAKSTGDLAKEKNQ
jgi:hypothetical protein